MPPGWGERPFQKLCRVIKSKHVIIVLNVVLIQQCVELRKILFFIDLKSFRKNTVCKKNTKRFLASLSASITICFLSLYRFVTLLPKIKSRKEIEAPIFLDNFGVFNVK